MIMSEEFYNHTKDLNRIDRYYYLYYLAVHPIDSNYRLDYKENWIPFSMKNKLPRAMPWGSFEVLSTTSDNIIVWKEFTVDNFTFCKTYMNRRYVRINGGYFTLRHEFEEADSYFDYYIYNAIVRELLKGNGMLDKDYHFTDEETK